MLADLLLTDGLEEEFLDERPVEAVQWLTLESAAASNARMHELSSALSYPPQPFYSDCGTASSPSCLSLAKRFRALSVDLPSQANLLSLDLFIPRTPVPLTLKDPVRQRHVLMRLNHVASRDPDFGFAHARNVSVCISCLFAKPFSLKLVVELTLGGNMIKANCTRTNWAAVNGTIKPLTLKPALQTRGGQLFVSIGPLEFATLSVDLLASDDASPSNPDLNAAYIIILACLVLFTLFAAYQIIACRRRRQQQLEQRLAVGVAVGGSINTAADSDQQQISPTADDLATVSDHPTLSDDQPESPSAISLSLPTSDAQPAAGRPAFSLRGLVSKGSSQVDYQRLPLQSPES